MMRKKTISTHPWAKVKKAMLLELRSRSPFNGLTSKTYKLSYNMKEKSPTKWIIDHTCSSVLRRAQ